MCINAQVCATEHMCGSEETLNNFLMVPLVEDSVRLAAQQATHELQLMLWSVSHPPGGTYKCTTVSGFYLGSEDLNLGCLTCVARRHLLSPHLSLE